MNDWTLYSLIIPYQRHKTDESKKYNGQQCNSAFGSVSDLHFAVLGLHEVYTSLEEKSD